jgi:hypothetical protein
MGVAVIAALVGLTAAPAAAATAAVTPAVRADGAAAMAALKTEITRRIDLRLAALTRFDRDLTAAKNLTDAHQGTLHTLITTDSGGLTTLKGKVAEETTLAALQADAKSMVNDYRVFVLVGPKVRLTIANDAEVAATAKLRGVHDSLAALVAAQKAKGVDTAAAEQDLADMTAALDRAGADINGQVGTLLGLQAGPDGTALRTAVAGVRKAIGTGRTDLKNAVAEAKHVRDFLKSPRS